MVLGLQVPFAKQLNMELYAIEMKSFSPQILFFPNIKLKNCSKNVFLKLVVYSLFQAQLFDEPQLASLFLENIRTLEMLLPL